ncbi:hypothetical protein [Hymenobacter saemangeumensis]|uniref:hypothetical protein n=1 Tax=Hymenobacter saemangeumensis TaxID=1084522 RepID=UPI0031EE2F77
MKSLSCYWLLLSAFFLLSVSGCSKKEEPIPSTGTLDGIVSPAGAVTQLSILSSGGQLITVLPNAATGAFSLKNLASDDYTLTFQANSNYTAPRPRTVQVVAGQHTALGTIAAVRLLSGPPSGRMELRANDTTYTTTVVGGFVPLPGNTIILNATFGQGTAERGINIMVPNFSGVGTYTFPINTSSSYPYHEANYGRFLDGYRINYRTSTSPSNMQVAAYDPATRTISGTFTCINMYPMRIPSPPNITISGTFNLTF